MVLAVGDYRLDIERRELRRGAGLVALPPKAFDLLVFLVRHRDRVVGKDDLLREVWGGRIVSESAITTRINAVRRALGDDGTTQRLVRTFIGRGVRFVGEVADVSEGEVLTIDVPNEQSLSINAERRQLTVMFCELAGLTSSAARVDPEDLRDVLDAYHGIVAEVVATAGGCVAKTIGDEVFAYFGYPRAQEHDAERAVRAALLVIERVGGLECGPRSLACRAGIATGLVVVGDLYGLHHTKEHAVVGEAVNVAARLKAMASGNAVFIEEGTRRLVGDLFECRDLGVVCLEGKSYPVQAWQALRESHIKDRFAALRPISLSLLVGREEELELLRRRWTRVRARLGQVVLLGGEAGLGKSRLVTALQDHLVTDERFELRYFCPPHRQDSALFPITEQLGRAAGFIEDDAPAERLKKLEAALAAVAKSEEDVALIADLLSLPAPVIPAIAGLSPQQKKERTLETLMRLVERFADTKPVLMIFEDVHWIDPTSREFLDLLLERIREIPVLLVITHRPEFVSPWAGRPQVSTMTLSGLDRQDTTTLINSIAGGRLLPPQIVKQIGDRTDGVPLFIEELTNNILESGLLHAEADRYTLIGSLPPPAIPATLQASLIARLDRLSSVRHLAQVGAAIGREFSYKLLDAVSGVSGAELAAELEQLVASGLVFQRGVPPDAVYSLRHALIQDTAHSSLLRRTRQQLHTRIAEVLEARSPELVDTQPELLAQHYAEGGLAAKSVTFWDKAARRSAARSAMAEAAAQFQQALNQLALLPETLETQDKKLELLSGFGTVIYALKGPGAPEMGLAYASALELWTQLGSPPEFIGVPSGRLRYLLFRGELELALGLDEDLLRLSRRRNDAAGLITGLTSVGRTLMFTRKFVSSRSHLEEALSVHNAIGHYTHYGGNPGYPQLACQAYLGIVLFCLGYPDQALSQSDAAAVAAHALGHPVDLVTCMALRARLLSVARGDAELGEQADRLISRAIEQGLPQWQAQGRIYRGWVTAKGGDLVAGLSLLRSGLSAFRASGTELWVSQFLSLLACACELAGEIEEGLAPLDEAQRTVERTRERWLEAELYRLHGLLVLKQGHAADAEILYRKAVRIAAEQDAKSWELRAAISLARLWGEQARRVEAYDLLAPIVNWFTEGFVAADLTEAKALLEQLA
ncbi:MAG TPA: AAA family ATPase [Xanthobacteraceae bacterium]